MKKDWSIIRVTSLLYFIVVLLPVNYYFAKNSFDAMQNDAKTMQQLVYISGALSSMTTIDNSDDKKYLVDKVDASMKTIEDTFIGYDPNKKYVVLFRTDEVFTLLKNSYEEFKEMSKSGSTTREFRESLFDKVNAFSKTTEEMISYKINETLDMLYISLAFTMLSIVALVFFMRTYMRLQLIKHSIHDHLSGLYNKKYFDNVLEHSELLAIRQGHDLSLLVLRVNNYDELINSMTKKDFEKNIREFSKIFNHFFRHSDTVCRIEEKCFASIAPDATNENIKKLSNRLKQKLRSKYLNKSINMDISIGVSTYNKDSSTSLLEEAKNYMHDADSTKLGCDS